MATKELTTKKKVVEIRNGIYELREHTTNEFGYNITRTVKSLSRDQENEVICQLGVDARLNKLFEFFPEADEISFEVVAVLDF